jgi:hypothetical protein
LKYYKVVFSQSPLYFTANPFGAGFSKGEAAFSTGCSKLYALILVFGWRWPVV